MRCPRCSSVLKPVDYDDVQIEVCPDCEGEWLPKGELLKVVEQHEEVFTPKEIAAMDSVNKEIFATTEVEHDELHCPQCENVEMKHFNYGDTSGIILDKCPKCNGIWTDRNELEQVEELVDGWKSYLEDDTEKYGSILKKIAAREEQDLDKSVSISRYGFVNAILRSFFA